MKFAYIQHSSLAKKYRFLKYLWLDTRVSGESFPAWFHDWPPSSYSAQTSSRRPTTMGSWMAWPFSSITLFSRPRPHDHRHIILLAPIPAYTLWNYTIVPCAINVWLNVFYVKVQGSASIILLSTIHNSLSYEEKDTPGVDQVMEFLSHDLV